MAGGSSAGVRAFWRAIRHLIAVRQLRSVAVPAALLAVLSLSATPTSAHFTGDASYFGVGKRTICYRLSDEVKKDPKWPGWIRSAINNWNQLSDRTDWKFVPCPEGQKRADLDFQFIPRQGNLSADSGTPIDSSETGSLSSVKIVKDIDNLNINGTVVSGGFSGWDVTDGPNGERRLDPVLTIMHEFTHVMRLDHATEKCSTTDFEEPVCAGDHTYRDPSISDLNQIRFASNLTPYVTVTVPKLPAKGCFDTAQEKADFLKMLKTQIAALQDRIKENNDRLVMDYANVDGSKERAKFGEKTVLEFDVAQDTVNLKALEALEHKASKIDVCGHTMRTSVPSLAEPSSSSTFFAFSGLNAGFTISETTARLDWIETFANTGDQTNRGSVLRDPQGLGFNVGYGFTPWGNNIVVGPFMAFDYLGWSVNQSFPGGSTLGTRSNYDVMAGVKIGPTVGPNAWLYAIGSAGILNENLTINFIPKSSSTTTTVAGGSLGFGAALQPGFLKGFGQPMSLSLEFQHTWWGDATYNTPAASPLFNYNYRRQDDTFKLGLNIYFSQPAPARR